MRIFNIVNIDYGSERLREFCINNFNAVSSSIKSIVSQVRVNKDNISKTNVDLNSIRVEAWTTANRPTNTVNAVTIGINTTTGNINYTTDSGTTWKNYDGTAA